MALFVQIDHFRKTDQKPTVKNHLFSISWFRSFNRTSFQQQLKRNLLALLPSVVPSFNRTSFQQQLKLFSVKDLRFAVVLQSYILSTTTETGEQVVYNREIYTLQSYILSTTTETLGARNVQEARKASIVHPFNNN